MSGPLTRPEFIVLEAHRQAAPESQRALARQTGLSLGYVNQTLQRLRAVGFLGADSTLTPAGWEALEPYRVTNAIIMAAGMSTRFAPISYARPKGLLVVKGEVLIERQIRQLQAAGINDITVVVGYRQEQFFYLEDAFGVHIAVNTEYRERNNNSSLKAVEGLLDNTYICSSDDYFTQNVFEPYVYQGYYAGVWNDGPSEEWGVLTAPSGRIIAAATGMSNTWVMMGHAYWDRSFSLRFRSILDAVYDHSDTAPKLWEAIYADSVSDLNLQLRQYPDGVIWEFDTPDDLRAFDPDFISNTDSAILDNICATLGCSRDDLSEFTPMTGGMTNLSVRFSCNGAEYVYRHPGLATQGVLNRGAEAQAEAIASQMGLDDTFIYMNPDTGWKISHYWNGLTKFDYHNADHVTSALRSLRKLHTQTQVIDHSFDLLDEATMLADRIKSGVEIAQSGRLNFSAYADLQAEAARLHQLCQREGTPPVLCHNDFYEPNILILGQRQAFIDWEYAGMGDYASDLGTFICCSDYTREQAVQALQVYYGRQLSDAELRHCVAYVGLAAFYWWVWALYKDACGDDVGAWTYRWYRYAKDYSEWALELYEHH